MEQPTETSSKGLTLHSVHSASGAKFLEVDGWLLPAYFTSPIAENLAVRNNVGIIDLSNRGYLKVSGPDRTSFLQGIITNDVSGIVPGMGLHAAILTVKGKVLADFILSAYENHFIIETDASIIEKLYSTLTRYRIREKVTFEVLRDLGSIGVQGPESGSILSKMTGETLANLKLYQHTTRQFDQEHVTIRKQSVTGETGYLITVSVKALPTVWTRLLEAGEESKLLPVGYDAAESLRIEAGLPRYGRDLTEENIPLEIEEQDMVSFTKGCYVGQEVVARLKFLGQANKHLKGLLITDPSTPNTNSRVTKEEKEIGRITSSTYSPTLKQPIAMSYLRREYSTTGTKVSVESDGRDLSATVTDLPFIKR